MKFQEEIVGQMGFTWVAHVCAIDLQKELCVEFKVIVFKDYF